MEAVGHRRRPGRGGPVSGVPQATCCVRIGNVSAKKSPRRATATDAARASNVSQATVSYVMNNTPGQTIPQATRDRVLEAARRLGYVPNASAQILAGGGSRFV